RSCVRSRAPFSGRHSSATPSLPAIEVNVPHSWTTSPLAAGTGFAAFRLEVLITVMTTATAKIRMPTLVILDVIRVFMLRLFLPFLMLGVHPDEPLLS